MGVFLSGGIDSSLTAVLAVDAVGAGNVTGVGMPGIKATDQAMPPLTAEQIERDQVLVELDQSDERAALAQAFPERVEVQPKSNRKVS